MCRYLRFFCRLDRVRMRICAVSRAVTLWHHALALRSTRDKSRMLHLACASNRREDGGVMLSASWHAGHLRRRRSFPSLLPQYDRRLNDYRYRGATSRFALPLVASFSVSRSGSCELALLRIAPARGAVFGAFCGCACALPRCIVRLPMPPLRRAGAAARKKALKTRAA